MLTARQRGIWDWIAQFEQQHGFMPTLREIGSGMQIASTNGVVEHLQSMERKGWIRRSPGKTRALQLLRPQCSITDEWLLLSAEAIHKAWPDCAADLTVNQTQGWWLLTLLMEGPCNVTIDPYFHRSCWDCSSPRGHVYRRGPIPDEVWRSAIDRVVSAPTDTQSHAEAL